MCRRSVKRTPATRDRVRAPCRRARRSAGQEAARRAGHLYSRRSTCWGSSALRCTPADLLDDEQYRTRCTDRVVLVEENETLLTN
jgi:hypothetical protein